MSTTTNPIYSSLVAGMNPTGSNIALENLLGGSSTGANPLLPNVNLSPTSAGTSNQYSGAVVPGAPAFPANTGGGYTSSLNLMPTGQPTTNVGAAAASPIGGMNLMSSKDLSRMFDSLKKTYGDGTAHAILDFLTTGAGFNQQSVSNLLASLQPGIQRGTESLMEQFSTLGNRFGSGAQIGLGDYLSQVNLNEGQLVSQMYQQAVQNYMDVLTGTGSQVAQTRASSPTGLDSILQMIGLGGSAGQGLSQIISAISPGASTGVLDAIAGAAAGF